MMTIGDRIKTLRESKGITQSELAKAIHSTKQTIYKYENNIITNIPSDKIEKISVFLSCSPGYLMGWEKEGEGKEDGTPKLIDELAEAAKKLSPENQRKLLDVARVMFGDKIDD